jgi:hypothetical protein
MKEAAAAPVVFGPRGGEGEVLLVGNDWIGIPYLFLMYSTTSSYP